jgi:hypothetical protein
MDQGELVCDAHDHMADSPAHWAPAHGRRHGGADMHVVLAGERPCRILHASPEWLAEFDFASSEVFGRTLGVIQGPATHGARFVELLRTARWAKQAHGVLVFYARHGQDGAYSVHVQCVGDASDDIAYKLSFTRCDDASWKTATSDDGLAKAVIDAAEPWRAVHVSRELGDLYGLLPEEILGRSLNIVHGPNTDYREWASLLHAGGSGLSPRAVLMTSTRDCRELCVQVTVKPVFGGDSTILHLLLIFSAVDAPELHASRREELQPDPGAPFRVRAQPLPTEGNKWGATTRGTTHTHHQQHHITRLPGEGSMCPDMLSGGARQSGQGLSETGGGGPSGVSSAVSHRLLPMHMPEYAWSPVAEDSQEFARAQEPSLHHLGPAGFAGMQDKGELGHYAAHGHATCRPEAGPPGNFAPVRPVPGRHPRPYLPTFDYTPTPSEHYVPFSVQGSVHSSDGSNGHGLQGSRHVLQRSAHTLQASAHADHARQQMPLAVHAVSEDVGGVGGGAGVFTHRVAHRDVAHRDVRQADAAVHAELQHGNQWLLEARAPLQQQPARAPAGQASAPFPQQPSSMRADAQMGLLPVDAPAPLDMTSLLHMRYGWEMNASLQEQREEAFGIGSEQQGSSHTGACVFQLVTCCLRLAPSHTRPSLPMCSS